MQLGFAFVIIPISHVSPVQPLVHAQRFGAMQCPPCWHGELQTAVNWLLLINTHNTIISIHDADHFGNVPQSILMCSYIFLVLCTHLHSHRVGCIQLC